MEESVRCGVEWTETLVYGARLPGSVPCWARFNFVDRQSMSPEELSRRCEQIRAEVKQTWRIQEKTAVGSGWLALDGGRI